MQFGRFTLSSYRAMLLVEGPGINLQKINSRFYCQITHLQIAYVVSLKLLFVCILQQISWNIWE